MPSPQIICHQSRPCDYTLFDIHWVPSSPRMAVCGSTTSGEGVLALYTLAPDGVQEVSRTNRKKALRCGTFRSSCKQDRHFATGDFAGGLDIWDLEVIGEPLTSVKAHGDIINAVDGGGGDGPGAPELVTGSRDGLVKVWDRRQLEKPVVTMSPREGEARRDCWTVAVGNNYSDCDRMVAAGYANGDIRVFDLKTMSVFWETTLPHGVCRLEFNSQDTAMDRLLAVTVEGGVCVWDANTFGGKGGGVVYEGGDQATVWTGRHLPQDKDVIMTGDGVGNVELIKMKQAKKVLTKDGTTKEVPGKLEKLCSVHLSDQPVSSIDWSPDKTGLAATTSFDQSIRVVFTTNLQ